MNTVYVLVQQMMIFSIPLLIVALGGMFSERSGIINIALEGLLLLFFLSIKSLHGKRDTLLLKVNGKNLNLYVISRRHNL